MSKHTLSDHSTIYHYTLLYKFTRRHPFFWVHTGLFVCWAALDATTEKPAASLLAYGGSIIILILLQAALGKLLSRFTTSVVPRTWGWSLRLPIPGFIPTGMVVASSWQRANRHRFFIGCFFIAGMYPWLSPIWFYNLLTAHVILLLPQMMVIAKCCSILKQGLIKVSDKDISLYKN